MPGWGGAAVFWLLSAMSLTTFALCVLTPEYDAYQALQQAQRAELTRVAQIRELVTRERRLIDGLRGDPALVARLARRDLGFHGPDEKTVWLFPQERGLQESDFVGAFGVRPVPVISAAVPVGNERLMAYLTVFRDPGTRPLIMAMSVFLIAVAFLLFGGRPVRPATEHCSAAPGKDVLPGPRSGRRSTRKTCAARGEVAGTGYA